MIVKKVKNPQHSASKPTRIHKLTDYIRSPENKNAKEKCIYTGDRAFITRKHHSQKAEMIALAQDCVRCKNPISHYVLSWPEEEKPNAQQVEQAVDLFLEQLGWQDHQVIFGLHADTDNYHLHLAINRVHPLTEKVVKVYKDIEQAHMAIARIEEAQGWRREQRGRYQVIDGKPQRIHHERSEGQPSQRSIDIEVQTGEKSAERIAIEQAAPLLQSARTWEDLHRLLAAEGMRYERFGSGAVVYVGEVAIKASAIHRSASFTKMQQRLGSYQPAAPELTIPQRAPEPLAPTPEWERYMAERDRHTSARDTALLELKVRHDKDRTELRAAQAQQRVQLLSTQFEQAYMWTAFRSLLAEEHQAERRVLVKRQQRERAQVVEQYPPFPTLRAWLEEQGSLNEDDPELLTRLDQELEEATQIDSASALHAGLQVAPDNLDELFQDAEEVEDELEQASDEAASDVELEQVQEGYPSQAEVEAIRREQLVQLRQHPKHGFIRAVKTYNQWQPELTAQVPDKPRMAVDQLIAYKLRVLGYPGPTVAGVIAQQARYRHGVKDDQRFPSWADYGNAISAQAEQVYQKLQDEDHISQDEVQRLEREEQRAIQAQDTKRVSRKSRSDLER